jgi:hypothetical protein
VCQRHRSRMRARLPMTDQDAVRKPTRNLRRGRISSLGPLSGVDMNTMHIAPGRIMAVEQFAAGERIIEFGSCDGRFHAPASHICARCCRDRRATPGSWPQFASTGTPAMPLRGRLAPDQMSSPCLTCIHRGSIRDRNAAPFPRRRGRRVTAAHRRSCRLARRQRRSASAHGYRGVGRGRACAHQSARSAISGSVGISV